jgi:hypothetical protein
MGILDRLRGTGVQRPLPSDNAESPVDDQALARYRYLLRTAPPETIEQAHAEAFAQLTPEQRRRVLQELSSSMSTGERMAAARAADDPEVLARMATRAEIRQPGTLERVLGGASAFGAPGLGSMMAGGFFAGMAGSVLGSMIAQQFFSSHAAPGHLSGDGPPHDAPPSADTTAGIIDDSFKHASTDRGEDFASGEGIDPGASDFGSDDDLGGGDFGGGDSFDT